MEDSLKDFKAKVRKLNAPRKCKIRNSYGIREAFLYLQSNKWFDIGQSLKEQQFQHIIRDINSFLAEELIRGRCVELPQRMGELEVIRNKRGVRIKNGKLINNYYIDWNKTLELWSRDNDAYSKKTLVRNLDNMDWYFIFYNKHNANYKNKIFFLFRGSRIIQRAVSQNVKNGLHDNYNIRGYGYWIY